MARSAGTSSISSARAVSTTSSGHAAARRPMNPSRRELISSAQCRSSRTSTSGCMAARCSSSAATPSNRRRDSTVSRGASPSSGRRRASSARHDGSMRSSSAASVATRAARSASTHGANARICSDSHALPVTTDTWRAVAAAASSATMRLLPTPASPSTAATPPPLAAAPSSADIRSASSAVRPTNGEVLHAPGTTVRNARTDPRGPGSTGAAEAACVDRPRRIPHTVASSRRPAPYRSRAGAR